MAEFSLVVKSFTADHRRGAEERDDPLAVGFARPAADDRHQVRLRHRHVRRVHGAPRRCGSALLSDSGARRAWAKESPPLRVSGPTASTRCRKRGLPSRCRNAAIASRARSCRPRHCWPTTPNPPTHRSTTPWTGNICRCAHLLPHSQGDSPGSAGDGPGDALVKTSRRSFLHHLGCRRRRCVRHRVSICRGLAQDTAGRCGQ